MIIETLTVDYDTPNHQSALIKLMEEYALDPMGGQLPLSAWTKNHLVSNLKRLPQAFSVLATAENQYIGLANCFYGFSTFRCQPLINIHDIIVTSTYRNRGVAQHLLRHIEKIAKKNQCCKLTLEVLMQNNLAQNCYRKFGFNDYELKSPEVLGPALFLEKYI